MTTAHSIKCVFAACVAVSSRSLQSEGTGSEQHVSDGIQNFRFSAFFHLKRIDEVIRLLRLQNINERLLRLLHSLLITPLKSSLLFSDGKWAIVSTSSRASESLSMS